MDFASYPGVAASFLAITLLLLLAHRLIRRLRARSIAFLLGPPPGGWIVGNLPEIFAPNHAAEAEFAWTREYGHSMRVKGALGLDILLTSDPKALQYILNTSGYNFPKPQQNAAISRLLGGEGLVFARGSQHVRHRKIMNPGFSFSTLKVFLPLFRETAQKGVSKWKDIIVQNGGAPSVINIPPWLGRIALDAMGAAALDYKFGALDESNNELSNKFMNLTVDAFYKRSNFTLLMEALWGYLPWTLVKLLQNLPTQQLNRLRDFQRTAKGVAKNIVDTQTGRFYMGKEGGKDIMSILVRANLSEDPKVRLSEHELSAQLTTLMFGGYEPTSSSLTWTLYELSRHPSAQAQIRAEIQQARERIAQRGDGEFTVADLDSMKYLLAVIKETLRYHPTVMTMNREAGRDDVIPLAMPQKTGAGGMITSIPVSKGQRVIMSVAMYNRLPEVWGEDAEIWRPERFLEVMGSGKERAGLGVLSNLATFSSGIRGCIGWRFSMIEMQAMLIELLENFEFSPAPGNPEIIRCATGFMSPM
ncbi:cytochrome P450 [Ramaria rubella]|nr:cytochrome P450 [Ramaria rubella]